VSLVRVTGSRNTATCLAFERQKRSAGVLKLNSRQSNPELREFNKDLHTLFKCAYEHGRFPDFRPSECVAIVPGCDWHLGCKEDP
jgi:hypothetical protein